MVCGQGVEEYFLAHSLLTAVNIVSPADFSENKKKYSQTFGRNNIFTIGEVVEWSITAVLKTVELKGSGGSNPSLSAEKGVTDICNDFFNFSVTKNVTKISVRPIFHSKKMQVDSGGHIRKP